MYCSSCGVVVAQGLSYCNHCGAKLNSVKGDAIVKSSELKPESLIWGMVAVLIFGFAAIVFLMMAMKMVGLNVGQILGFMVMSFLMMLSVEGVFIWRLLGRKSSAEKEPMRSNVQSTKELDAAQARALPDHLTSVTEHTTRSFEPIYSERKSK